MPTARSTAGAASHRLVALLLIAIATAAGCHWSSWIPGDTRAEASRSPGDVVPLYTQQPHRAELDCPTGSCQTRYRIQLREPGVLHVEVIPSLFGSDVGMRIALEDFSGKVLGEQRAHGEETAELKSEVEAGPHVVTVQVTGGRVDYELTATIARDTETPARRTETPVRLAPEPSPPPTDRVGDRIAVPGSDSAYDPRVDFSRYRRFAFSERPEEKLQRAPGTAVGNPFLEAEVQRAIRLELLDRGFDQDPEAEADFLVTAHVGAQSETWYAIDHTRYSGAYDQWFDRWGTSGAQLRTHTYRDGTLVIDIIDVSGKELSWHGWTTQPIPPAVDAKTLIRKIVAKVLDQFPPH